MSGSACLSWAVYSHGCLGSEHTPCTHYALYTPSTLDTLAQVGDCRLLFAVSLLYVHIFLLLIET